MQSSSLKLLLLFFVLLLLPACGGGGGGSSSSSSGNSGSQPSGTNVLAVTVNGSTCDSSINSNYINDACVSVSVCSPGTSNCVAINSILLDTGSFGLRVFKQALGSVSLAQVASGSGSLAECVQYADNTSDWGPVQTASVILGNEPAVQVPIQVIDSTFGAIPTSCGPSGGFTPDTQPSVNGINGILGVGPFIYDCGATCVTSITNPALYYTCSGSTCSGTTVPLKNQVQNPVAALPLDNNGVIVQLPNIAAGGASSVTGSLVLGINTQTNNVPSGVTTYTLNQNGDFVTIFNNSTFTDASNPPSGSFIDTGSNGLFFPSPSGSSPDAGELLICSGNSGFFCPLSTVGFSATIEGASGSPTGTVSFQIGNLNNLISSTSKVFNDIGGNMSGSFDWGLPFYFGRNVYIGFESSKNPGTGQYFAF